jgi:hypothetical protein
VRNLIPIVGLTFSAEATAKTPAAKIHIHFAGRVDCDQPILAKKIPIGGDGPGILNTGGSVSTDVTQSPFIFFGTIHSCGRPRAAQASREVG